MLKCGLMLLAMLGVIGSAWAQPKLAEVVQVEDAWVLPTKVGAKAFPHLTLANWGEVAVTFIRVESPVAAAAALRHHHRSAGVPQIASGGHITLPPRSRVRLLPGATEVMLSGLQEPLLPGTEIPLSLTTEAGQTLMVRVKVGP